MAIIFEKALQKESRVVQFELGKIRVQKGKIPTLSVTAAGCSPLFFVCLPDGLLTSLWTDIVWADFRLTDAKYANAVAGLIFAMSVPWHLDLRGNEYEETDMFVRALLSSTSLESLNRLTVDGDENDNLPRVIQDRCAKCLLKHAVFRLTLFWHGRPTGCAAICYTRKRFTVCGNL